LFLRGRLDALTKPVFRLTNPCLVADFVDLEECVDDLEKLEDDLEELADFGGIFCLGLTPKNEDSVPCLPLGMAYSCY